MPDEPRQRTAKPGATYAMCIALGTAGGAALAAATDDWGAWLPVGVAIGVAIGVAVDQTMNVKRRK